MPNPVVDLQCPPAVVCPTCDMSEGVLLKYADRLSAKDYAIAGHSVSGDGNGLLTYVGDSDAGADNWDFAGAILYWRLPGSPTFPDSTIESVRITWVSDSTDKPTVNHQFIYVFVGQYAAAAQDVGKFTGWLFASGANKAALGTAPSDPNQRQALAPVGGTSPRFISDHTIDTFSATQSVCGRAGIRAYDQATDYIHNDWTEEPGSLFTPSDVVVAVAFRKNGTLKGEFFVQVVSQQLSPTPV